MMQIGIIWSYFLKYSTGQCHVTARGALIGLSYGELDQSEARNHVTCEDIYLNFDAKSVAIILNRYFVKPSNPP